MSNKFEKLEVVNEKDEVVGLETREKIHKEGLLHREIHIWFITPNGEIILQHRAKDKDTYPDKLDATVGGHVEPGMTYNETAIKECEEETGIKIDISKLVYLDKIRKKSFDNVTGMTNNTFRVQYTYLYDRNISDLVVEDGKAEGFELWSIDKISNLSDLEKEKFLSVVYSDEILVLFKKAKEIFNLK